VNKNIKKLFNIVFDYLKKCIVSLDIKKHWPIFIIALIFEIKLIILATWIIPFNKVPDELQHLKYVIYMADNLCLPQDLGGLKSHPPLYYIINGIILRISHIFTDDRVVLLRYIPRFLSGIAASLSLIVMYYTFWEVLKKRSFCLTAILLIIFLPSFATVGAGVHHETFLVLMMSLGVFFWVKFIKTQKLKYGIIMGIWLSCAAVTKYTALPVNLILVLPLFFQIKGDFKQKFSRFILITLVVGILPGLFGIRNYRRYGQFFPLSESVRRIDIISENNIENKITNRNEKSVKKVKSFVDIITPHFSFVNNIGTSLWNNFYGIYYKFYKLLYPKYPMIDFLKREHPVHIVLTYFIAFVGSANHAFAIRDSYFDIYVNIYFIIVLAGCGWYLNNLTSKITFFNTVMLMFFVIFTFSIYYYVYFDRGLYLFSLNLLLTLFLGMLILGLHPGRIFWGKDVRKIDLISYYSLLVIFFYTLLYLYHIKPATFSPYQVIRALHGRYFYLLIPLFVLAFITPAYRFIKPGKTVLFIIISIIATTEMVFYLNCIFPFYGNFALW